MTGILELTSEMRKVSEPSYGARLSLWKVLSQLVRSKDFPPDARIQGCAQGVSISNPWGSRILFAAGSGCVRAFWMRLAKGQEFVEMMEMDIGSGDEAVKTALELLWNTAPYEEEEDDAKAGQK